MSYSRRIAWRGRRRRRGALTWRCRRIARRGGRRIACRGSNLAPGPSVAIGTGAGVTVDSINTGCAILAEITEAIVDVRLAIGSGEAGRARTGVAGAIDCARSTIETRVRNAGIIKVGSNVGVVSYHAVVRSHRAEARDCSSGRVVVKWAGRMKLHKVILNNGGSSLIV